MAFAVNEPIAERYVREFGFRCEVIYNAASVETTLVFRPVDPERIGIVHVGMLQKERQPLLMVEAMALAPPAYHLHFYMLAPPQELEAFRRDCARIAPGRVTVHDPVPPADIVRTLMQYDLGISVIPPVHWSWLMTAPNKFFFYVAAGLGMILADKPWKRMMTERYGFAELTAGYSGQDIAAVLQRLTPGRINELKQRSVDACAELNGAAMCRKLLGFCEEAAGKKSA